MSQKLRGLERNLNRLRVAVDQASWWSAATDRIEAAAGGTVAPGLIAVFRRGRFALPMSMTPAEILAATPAAIAAAMRACSFADVATFTRASAGTYIDEAGQLEQAAAGVPRFDWSSGKRRLLLETASVNQLPWSGNAGAVVGTLGAGGTGALPTGHSFGSNASGISSEITSIGETNGIPWTEYRIHGTNTSGAIYYPDPRPSTTPAAATGQSWTYSAYAGLVAGSWPVTANAGVVRLAESDGSSLTSSVNGAKIGTWGRYSISKTITGGSTIAARGLLGLAIQIGETVDFTFRIGGLQLEQQPAATSYIPTAGATATRAADSCRLTDRAAAVLQRASAGLILQASSLRGGGGRMVGGASYSRLLGFSGSATSISLGATVAYDLAAVTTPLPDMGVAAGWDASGKAGSYQGGAVALQASALDTDLSAVYLGRDAAGNCATGLYDRLVAYPARPANAALPGKAVAYA